MFRVKIYFLTTICLLGLTVGTERAWAACQADVTLTVLDYNGQVIKGARFTIQEQLVDADGKAAPGKILTSGTTDKFTGVATSTVTLTEGLAKYAVKIGNPTFSNFDFWYFDQLTLACSQAASFTASLSAVKLKVSDYLGLLQKDVKYSLYAQKLDANGEPVLDKQVGSGTTGVTGEQIIYLPDPNRTYGFNATSYLLEIKNLKGYKFYKYNLSPAEGQLQSINYRFSDLVVNVKDAKTGASLPNIKLNMYVRKPAPTGGYEAGQSVTAIQTNENGVGYWQYPAGLYLLQYAKASGEKVSFLFDLKTEDRTTLNWTLEDFPQAKCAIKSTLTLSFRDFASKIIGNLNFNLYEQQLDNNGTPVLGAKVASGRADKVGLAKVTFPPQPPQRYILQVCDQSQTFGCAWFTGIDFQCKENLFLNKTMKAADVILRDSRNRLLPGQKFKIYVKQTNVDGKVVLDKTKQVGTFTLPASGRYRLYLDNRQLSGEPVEYLLAVDYGQKEVFAPFAMADSQTTILEYIIGDPLKAVRQSGGGAAVPTGLKGRIVLQVEAHGEAWYINPADNRRYFLGRPADAFNVMKRLSAGASNANLAKIKPNVDIVSATDIDTDSDGLADVLEQGLGTDRYEQDTDSDGFDDYTEIKNNYHPAGAGRWSFDAGFTNRNLGRILLQVEGNGEAWYINPVNGERYYLSRPADAFAIMRTLGLGISNADLAKIAIGE